MAKIASADREAMNALYKGEVTKLATLNRIAAENTDQAFKDHEEYIAVLEDVLSDDKKVEANANDPAID